MSCRPSRSVFLFSLLMMPVFLSGCATQNEYDQLATENARLRDENLQLQLHVRHLQEAIKYTVNSDLLFPSGGWQISDAGKAVIAKMATMLAPNQQDKLVVNGYTDSAPVGAALQKQGITSNQVLSEKRADAVMQYLISQGVKPELVSARGFGEADPIADNDTAQGRAQNRRVEITIAGS